MDKRLYVFKWFGDLTPSTPGEGKAIVVADSHEEARTRIEAELCLPSSKLTFSLEDCLPLDGVVSVPYL